MASDDEWPFWAGRWSLVGGENGAPEGTPLCRDALEVELRGELGLPGRELRVDAGDQTGIARGHPRGERAVSVF